MQKIFKYPISLSEAQTIELPEGATMLSIKMQRGFPCMWVLLDPEAPKRLRHFTLYPTGSIIPNRVGKYIDTFMTHEDKLVFHVFMDA